MKAILVAVLVALLLTGCNSTFERDHSKNNDITMSEDRFKSIDFGDDHITALKVDGEVYSWGDNSKGQCDVPDNISNAIAIASGDDHSLALLDNGKVVAWGDNSKGQCNVPAGLNDVVAITAGDYHNIALRKDGTIVAWGDNSDNQTTVPDDLDKVASISAGINTSAVVTTDGSFVTWGSIPDYDLEPPEDIKENRTKLAYISCCGYHIIALTNDNTVIGWGRATFDETSIPEDLESVEQIATGTGLSIALKDDGKVIAWGDDLFYGISDYAKKLGNISFIAADYFIAGAINENGNIIIFGENAERFANNNIKGLEIVDLAKK